MSKDRFRAHEVELRENALKLTKVGRDIMLNSIQKRVDSKTIVLIKKQTK